MCQRAQLLEHFIVYVRLLSNESKYFHLIRVLGKSNYTTTFRYCQPQHCMARIGPERRQIICLLYSEKRLPVQARSLASVVVRSARGATRNHLMRRLLKHCNFAAITSAYAIHSFSFQFAWRDRAAFDFFRVRLPFVSALRSFHLAPDIVRGPT